MTRPNLQFVARPNQLPALPSTGRLVLLDIAFAAGTKYDSHTLSRIKQAGDRLAAWIDHHRHPAWPEHDGDPRFVLVPRGQAPGCPQIITPELVARIGSVEHLWTHADFDGCLSAAKFLNGGKPCYEEMDEDARAIDSPGWGFKSSDRALRMSRALDQLEGTEGPLEALMRDIIESLLADQENPALTKRLESLSQKRIEHEADLMDLLSQTSRPLPEVLLLEVDWELGSANKKMLLRAMEYDALIAMIREPGITTIATYHSERGPGMRLSSIPGLKGLEGYAFGGPKPAKLMPEIEKILETYKNRGRS